MNKYFSQSFFIDEFGKNVIKKRYSCKDMKDAKSKIDSLKNEHRHSFNTSLEIIEIIEHSDNTETTVCINFAPIATATLTVERYTRTVAHQTFTN